MSTHIDSNDPKAKPKLHRQINAKSTLDHKLENQDYELLLVLDDNNNWGILLSTNNPMLNEKLSQESKERPCSSQI